MNGVALNLLFIAHVIVRISLFRTEVWGQELRNIFATKLSIPIYVTVDINVIR
jgi:hypothetical protein